ncbi:hypothetical protein ACLOJK_027321, partial [Asimina triloba]
MADHLMKTWIIVARTAGDIRVVPQLDYKGERSNKGSVEMSDTTKVVLELSLERPGVKEDW